MRNNLWVFFIKIEKKTNCLCFIHILIVFEFIHYSDIDLKLVLILFMVAFKWKTSTRIHFDVSTSSKILRNEAKKLDYRNVRNDENSFKNKSTLYYKIVEGIKFYKFEDH